MDLCPRHLAEQNSALAEKSGRKILVRISEREKASLKFLEYILSEEFQTEWALQTGYLPINLKSQKSEKYKEFVEKHQVLKVFLQQMEWARSRPIIPGYTRLSENLGRAIEASLLGDKNPEEALKEAQKRWDESK